MDKILIRGGVPLSGTIQIGGAKNAALPLMAASLLTAEPLVLTNVPDLADIRTMANLLVQHGCAIGTRPVDLHLKGLERLGAEVTLSEGYIEARAPKGLRGGEFVFPNVSVGATENLLMAATLADGETVLINAAREPEITDLAQCLVAMGAEIDGIGTDRLVVRGASSLHGAS